MRRYDAEIIYADADKVIIKGKGRKEEATYTSIPLKNFPGNRLYAKNNG